MRVAAWSWGAVRPLAQSMVHQDLQSRTGSACSLPLIISLPHPRRSSPCQDVGVWSPTSSFKHQLEPAKGAAIFWKKGMTRGWFPDDMLALIFRGELEALCRRENSFYRVQWVIWVLSLPWAYSTHRERDLPKAMLCTSGMPVLILCFGREPRDLIWGC